MHLAVVLVAAMGSNHPEVGSCHDVAWSRREGCDTERESSARGEFLWRILLASQRLWIETSR